MRRPLEPKTPQRLPTSVRLAEAIPVAVSSIAFQNGFLCRNRRCGLRRLTSPIPTLLLKLVPFVPLEELLEWRDSPEAEQLIELSDTLYDLLEDVQLDAKQRKFIWFDAEQLDLGQSVQRIQTQRPDFSHDQIEEFLIEWIENWLRPRKLLLGATRRA
jgi:hypothetical protein